MGQVVSTDTHILYIYDCNVFVDLFLYNSPNIGHLPKNHYSTYILVLQIKYLDQRLVSSTTVICHSSSAI